MDALEKLNLAYAKWKTGDRICRGFFNLAIDNIDYDAYKKNGINYQDYKLDDGTPAGLERILSDEWLDDKHKLTLAGFARSVRTLIKLNEQMEIDVKKYFKFEELKNMLGKSENAKVGNRIL